MKTAFEVAFKEVNERFNKLAKENDVISGTTAVAMLLDKENIYVANVGDAEGFIFENDKAISLTEAHNPSLPSEKERLEKEGAKVYSVGNVLRVNGTLAVSRSIGDPNHEPYLTSSPYFYHHKVSSLSKFFVIASDGLWDAFSFDQVAEIVNNHPLENRCDLAKHLVQKAMDAKSSDNISVIVGFF